MRCYNSDMAELERQIAFFDIDKTAYDGFLLFPMIDAQARAGFISSVSQDAINGVLREFESGGIDYAEMVRQTLNSICEITSRQKGR